MGVLIHAAPSGEPAGRWRLGFAYSLAVLAMQLVPLAAFAQKQFDSTGAALGSPSGTYDALSFYAVVSNMAWALWGYHPDGITELLAAMWPLFLLLSLLLLGRGGSRQTLILGAAAIAPIVLLLFVAAVRPRAVRGALLPGRRAAAAPPRGPARHRVDPQAGGAPARRRRRDPHPAPRPGRPADQRRQPAAVRLPRRDRRDRGRSAGPKSLRSLRAARTCAMCSSTTRPTSRVGRCAAACPSASEGSPVFVLASFQDNQLFFNRTNKVVGQLDFRRQLLQRVREAADPWSGSSDEQPALGRPPEEGHVGARAQATSACARGCAS